MRAKRRSGHAILVLSKLEREAPANFQRVKGVVGRDAAEHAYFARRASMSAPARHTLAMNEDQAPAGARWETVSLRHP